MKTILLVDDDDAVRHMLRTTLETMGHVVIEARDGRQALACQQATPAEIMLTDIVMPEKDGLETIQEFRRKHPQVKVIAMSGGGRVSAADYLRIAKPLGASVLLTKPFSIDELAAALAEVAPGP